MLHWEESATGSEAADSDSPECAKLSSDRKTPHHAFGLKKLQQIYVEQPAKRDMHRQQFADLYGQIQKVTDSVAPLFEFFDEDPASTMLCSNRDYRSFC